jgi:type VI secretion system protein ImpF
MADLTLKERLQPSLLDRLTDREPGTNRESRDRRTLSVDKIRDCVIRDLGWLLNTGHMASTEDLDAYPEVARSVLNYGAPDLAGVTASGTDVRALEKAVKQAIIDFEPRIMKDTLRVTIDRQSRQHNPSAIVFRIEGQMWAQPMPLSLFLRTAIDLETGTFDVVESAR